MTQLNRQLPLIRPLELLDRQELIDVIVDVLQVLYLDHNRERGFYWNPDLEWDVTTIDEVAAVFRNRGVVLEPDSKRDPAAPPVVKAEGGPADSADPNTNHPQLVLSVEGGVLISACCDLAIDVFLLDYDWAEESGGEVNAVRVPVEPLRELSDDAKAAVALAREAT